MWFNEAMLVVAFFLCFAALGYLMHLGFKPWRDDIIRRQKALAEWEQRKKDQKP